MGALRKGKVLTAQQVGAIACVVAVLALMEPRLASLGPWCSLVCLIVLVIRSGEGINLRMLPPLVGVFAGIIAATGYSLGADTPNYLANVASLLQDFDFETSNQFSAWGLPRPDAGPAGMSVNAHPIGNALFWAAPALVAHLYALAVKIYPTNFISPPYLGAMIAMNLAVALSGALALAGLLARAFGTAAAVAGVFGSVLASPVMFYLSVQPLMSHGLTFGFSCWAVVTVMRACESGLAVDWRWAGAALGAATACRFQAAILFLVVPILWRFERRDLRRVLQLAPPALLLLAPQAVVFWRTFGRPLAIPQGAGFLNWASPHWADTLFSADRGLFNWHPVLAVGLVGLLLPRRPLGRLAFAGIVVLVVTAWINGAVLDFNASDAFGARRYDLVIPFLGVGLTRLLAALEPGLARRPLAVPALLLCLAAMWNMSFMADYGKTFTAAAPTDDLVAAQLRRLRQGADVALGWLGPNARFRVYDTFVGLYTYRNYRPGGDFDLATLEPRFMKKGWSEVLGWQDETLFRYVLYPKACIVIPLDAPFDLHGYVLARSPARIHDQRISLILNGSVLTETVLPSAWTEVAFQAPARFWVAGENEFCVRLTKKRAGDEGADIAYAAAVVRVQLP